MHIDLSVEAKKIFLSIITKKFKKLLDKLSFRKKKTPLTQKNYTKKHKKTHMQKKLHKKTKVSLKAQSGRTAVIDATQSELYQYLFKVDLSQGDVNRQTFM